MRQLDYVEGWVHGWAHSRVTSAPVEIEGGWAIDTGMTRESRRYVLHTPTAEQVESIVESSPPPYACVKYVGGPSWESLFSTGWVRTDPAWFMLREITVAAAVAAPDGYDVRTVQASDTLLTTEIRTTAGELAARGQIGLGQVFVVPDQIVTEDSHRRRGLGSVVMNYLEQGALRAGRTRAVLGATSDGRALYTRLGWTTAAELTGYYHRPG
ncbi:hypothetical protein CH274_10350 [Rhodococcus sp. 06-418-5]|uniref:GNAT family N-acetyltransferase n=1 Tax=Rhodococcus sp. 06-418-5 TaxID=2022507 RepID=UPI000B9BDF7E|nr:GNAT family N-acetyltransferase [Rhodococcus sp. 06-418-5]OZC81239.1 hypothetical protein CH274_10350 [Rhodococcus sp. 06-418-5]